MQTSRALETLTLPTLKTFKTWLWQPSTLAWLSAAIVIVQGSFRLFVTPYHPNLGDGDVERLDAAIYFWKSVGVATLLGALGLYFWSNRMDARWD